MRAAMQGTVIIHPRHARRSAGLQRTSFGQLAVVLQVTGLISVVFVNDVDLIVLEVAKTAEHDVALADKKTQRGNL